MGRTVFRAIFMDVGMPIVDGDEATRMIKSTFNANRDTPIIAMAAYDDEATDILYDKDHRQAHSLGCRSSTLWRRTTTRS
ncbi:hypothetical protein DL89DRAFT_264437, partial [Linderina pennispora]